MDFYDYQNVEDYVNDPIVKEMLEKSVFSLSEAWEDDGNYLAATDRIIGVSSTHRHQCQDLMKTKEEALATARDLITRIRNKYRVLILANSREYYTCVGEINVNAFYIKKTNGGKKKHTRKLVEIGADGTAEETEKTFYLYDREGVQESVRGNIKELIEGKKLSIDDLIIDCCIVSHGQGVGVLLVALEQDCNPFESIYFKDGENKVKRFEGYMMSNVFSSVYEDVYVRFYSRTKENDDKWRRVVDTWRRTKHPYNLKYTDMEDEE